MLVTDLTTFPFFLGDRGSAHIAFRRLIDFVLLYQFLVLHGGCGDGGGCEDSVNELCEDSVVDVDGDCDTEAYISSLFVLRHAPLAAPFFKSFCIFNRVRYFHGTTLSFL